MKGSSPREELEKKYEKFQAEGADQNESLWDVFAQVTAGNNYVTIIAKRLKKNKSLVSRQIRRLAGHGIVTASGSGVKQSYSADWETFTVYWIWEMQELYSIIEIVPEVFEPSKLTPKWAIDLYLSPEESKESKKAIDVSEILEPVIPQLSQAIRLAVENLSVQEDVTNFWDAFYEVSIAFGFSVSELTSLIKPSEIDILHSRALVSAMFHPRVRAWLKRITLADMASVNVVRSYFLKMAGLLKG